jgi:hypothetical protein
MFFVVKMMSYFASKRHRVFGLGFEGILGEEAHENLELRVGG